MPGMQAGDVMGHETMGEVVELGSEVHNLKVGDKVVVPFTISCGDCFFCKKGLFSGCERSNPEPNRSVASTLWGHSPAGLFGYTHLLGGYAGGQAEYLRVPFADFGPIKVPSGLTDEQVLFLSDIFPTGYMGADFCEIQPGDTIAVFGCGPVGQFSIRSAFLLGAERVIAIDTVPERLVLARQAGAETIDFMSEDVHSRINQMTKGRGADACIDAVGTEASPGGSLDSLLDRAKQVAWMGTDRPHVLRQAINNTRNGGIVSIIGVYGGLLDKVPMGSAINRGLTFKMAQTPGPEISIQADGTYRKGRDRSDSHHHPCRQARGRPRYVQGFPRQTGRLLEGGAETMNEIQLSKSLGLFSLALGAAELLYGRTIKRSLGLPMPTSFVRAFGAREMLSGFVALAHPDNAGPMGLRIAGDAVDLAVLGTALLPSNSRRHAAAFATIAVIGVTVLDFAAAAALAKRESGAIRTARRIRVKRIAA